MLQTYYKPDRIKMTSISPHHSRAVTSFSRMSSNFHPISTGSLQLKQFWLRKSLFYPAAGLAESYAARRHFAGVEVPQIQILYSSGRWLLLQSPQTRTTFFENLKKGRLGNRDQQLLKLFKSFLALVRIYGYFRPTQKMIFMENLEIRVWINEDVFSNIPLMPINQGKSGQKHFVIAFLAMIQASLQNWERLSQVFSIEQTIKALQWRYKLSRGSRTAVNASQYASCKPEESNISFHQSQLGNVNNIISSQHLNYHTPLDSVRPPLSNSFTINETSGLNKAKDVRLVKKSVEVQMAEIGEQESIRNAKKKFGLHSTSSTLGNFSEKFRSTVGRKKLLEKSQNLQHQTPQSSPQIPTIQTEFQDLFADEGKDVQGGYDQEQLQRIAEQMQQFLTW